MTATATSSSQAVTEWTKIFPKQVTENHTSSVTFVKQLTVVAVSTITYLKNAFPEDSYMIETFGGVKLRILKKKCRDELAQFLSTALTQAFEAFDKKYLHQLALCFYENECKVENLIEYHIFEYTYHGDAVSMNVHSKNRDDAKRTTKYSFENVRERTIHLIRACVVIMQSCQNELPPAYDVSLRLYYNEDAPPDYQAPGYKCTDNMEDHLEPTLQDAVKLGWVETPFHRLVARSFIKEHMGASYEALPSQNPPQLSNEMQEYDEPTASSSAEPPLVCSCNKYDGLETSPGELLTCPQCNTRQHAPCYGVLPGERPPAHCCVRCTDRDPTRLPTDRKLATLSDRKRECLCIFRRTLDWCSRRSDIDGRTLADQFNMTEANASKLMKLLHSFGIIKHDPENSGNTPQEIAVDQLKSTINKYFITKEDNLVDRLMTDSFASQESLSDPIGNVLTPMEAVSLHSTVNIGRVVADTGRLKGPHDDATLKQYREAIMSNASEEPLKEPVEVGKKTTKRKIVDENKSTVRMGVKSKRARAAGPGRADADTPARAAGPGRAGADSASRGGRVPAV